MKLSLLAAVAIGVILFVAANSNDSVKAAGCLNDLDCDTLLNTWEANANSRTPGGLNIYKLGARKNHKDVFLEIDYMTLAIKNGTTCRALDEVVKTWANGEVSNPDGTKGVRLHLDAGKQCGANDYSHGGSNLAMAAGVRFPLVSFGAAACQNGLPINWYSQVINAAFNPNAARLAGNRVGVFHHSFFSGRYTDCNASSGIADFPGWHSIVTVGSFIDDSDLDWGYLDGEGVFLWTTGTIMHEFGHNFGLSHDGNTVPFGYDGDYQWNPNHVSVMAYHSQDGVWKWVCEFDTCYAVTLFDYQRWSLGALNETSLDETRGLRRGLANAYVVRHWCPGNPNLFLSFRIDDAFSTGNEVDWNCETPHDRTDVGIAFNINGSTAAVGATRNEWAGLDYSGGGTIGGRSDPNARRTENLNPAIEEEINPRPD